MFIDPAIGIVLAAVYGIALIIFTWVANGW